MTPEDLEKQINEQIKNVHSKMDEQKRIIKKSAGKIRLMQHAEAELKALHTRLAVLTDNLAKVNPSADPSTTP